MELSAESKSVFVAPARVNLIGEHTDYTNGLVMPMAISFTTEVAITPAPNTEYRFESAVFPEVRTLTQDDRSERVGNWTDYPVGVLRQLQARAIVPPPFLIHVRGDVPLGSGLSSSASIEVASAFALLAHAGAVLTSEEIALLCQRAENDFVGAPCGIMDQFVVTTAHAGHALLIHTGTLKYKHLPLNRGDLGQCTIVVANSGVKHSIAGGDYGVRRREVEAGQAVLVQRFKEVPDLGTATLEQLEQCAPDMSLQSLRRCRHIISENGRVREAAEAMTAGDPTRLGQIMTEAHRSERDDFECSVEEIDFLVDTAVSLDGCFGARLTGGGFGGCTVNLVETTKVDGFKTALRKAYGERFGIEAEMYVCTPVDGAMARTKQDASQPDSGESLC